MKLRCLAQSSLTVCLTFLCVLLAAPPPAHAQNAVKTNDFAFPWATVTAGVSSNIVSWGNASGNTAAASLRINPGGLGATFTWSFNCPTVTLAAASCVLQGSVDNATWANAPQGSGVIVLFVPASAASAGNTNVVYSTNVSQALLGNYPYWRIASSTNGNAATLTHTRLTVGNY